jgi:phosphoenolpyruvate---glycerone phosphotransferase subunit DhaK
MLTEAAPGPVFASPSVDGVVEAVRAADAGAEILQVVKNYAREVMTSGRAGDRRQRRHRVRLHARGR